MAEVLWSAAEEWIASRGDVHQTALGSGHEPVLADGPEAAIRRVLSRMRQPMAPITQTADGMWKIAIQTTPTTTLGIDFLLVES